MYPSMLHAVLIVILFLCGQVFGFNYKTRPIRHSTIIFAKSSSLPDYIRKAKEMVGGIEIDREAEFNLAFNIRQSEVATAILISTKDHQIKTERAIASKDLDTKVKILRNYYKKKLSSMSLRNALEQFFSRVIDLYKSGDVGLVEAIERTKSSSFAKNAKLEFPKMSVVNSHLLKEDIWKAVARALDVPPGVELPTFGPDLIYGAISDEIHNLQVLNIIISDKADDGRKLFFKWLSGQLKKRYSEFDEEMSYMGEEIEE